MPVFGVGAGGWGGGRLGGDGKEQVQDRRYHVAAAMLIRSYMGMTTTHLC